MTLMEFNVGLDRVAEALERIAAVMERIAPLEEIEEEREEPKARVYQTIPRGVEAEAQSAYLPVRRRGYGE